MNIIKSDVINSNYDIYWNEVTSFVNNVEAKPVLIITDGCADGSDDDVQLRKMLVACKLTPDQYNIIRLNEGERVAWHKLREPLNPGFIFLVGVLPSRLGISSLFRLNEPNHFNDRLWLPTLPIRDLEMSLDIKKQLWSNGIKPMFVDKAYGEISLQEKSKK